MDRLRRETAASHAAVEDTLPLMEDGLSLDRYIRCLQRIHGVVPAWERKAAASAPLWMQAILSARRRQEMLERDLAWFDVMQAPEEVPTLPEMDDLAKLLGTMYVMEGSTLGGQLIARHVEKQLGLEAGQGDAYFRGHGERTGPMWKEFCGMLQTHVPDSQTDVVVEGAKAMFAVFGTWMQESTELARS